MNLLDLLRQFAASNTDPAGSPERINALRDHLSQYRTENPDEPVDLAALDGAAMEAFEALRSGPMTAEALADMQVLADVCDGVRALAAEDQTQQAALDEQARALAARVGTDDEPGDGTDGDGTEGGAEGEPAGGDGTDGGTDGGTEVPADGEPQQTGDPALVASGRTPARRVPLSQLPNHRRRDPNRATGGHRWQAAADIRGINAGAELNEPQQLVEAVVARMSSFGRTPSRGTMQAGIALINRSARNGEFVVDVDVTPEMLERLTDETRLDGGSLVAAGGWCAPSETLYDLLPGSDPNAGIVDVPSVTARRGGIRWPLTPQFAALWASANTHFLQSEATVIAGATPKPCYEIGCTTFDEVRLSATGVCVRSPILTERGYPELVRQTIAEIMSVHMHKINADKIAAMVTESTANVIAAADITTAGYTATLLTAIELQVEYLRYRHRWPLTTTMEAVIPAWARGTLRADLAGRNGQPLENVTDAQVTAYLRTRGINPQWVLDWQDAFATGNAADFGGTTPPKRFPATLSILIYRAGTFFNAESDIITVDGLYDSALLADNMHLALFTEEGYAIGKRDWPAINLTVPVYPGGYTGEQLDPPALNLIPDPA